ncbi:hypothetical protein ABIA39_003340 [Nocardia sp. GAS34]|uniref:hypothetical protein n=1 Tax=unclassified Nocardia TaxID=2637762 RepID=UPI003D22A9EB
MGIRHRCPSEKTFRRVLSGLDAADLDRRLDAYFTGLAAAVPDTVGSVVVSLDGKTLRGARRGRAAASLVSMFAHRTRPVLAQLDEDRSTVAAGHAPQVMATLRNTAMNLHRIEIVHSPARPSTESQANTSEQPALEHNTVEPPPTAHERLHTPIFAR